MARDAATGYDDRHTNVQSFEMGLQPGNGKKSKAPHSRGTSYTTFNKDIKSSFSKQDKQRIGGSGAKLTSISVDK